MRFTHLDITDWKQFEKLDIDFHDRLTVLTGANGSGKTTILHMLARNLGWNFQELATPRKDEKSGVIKFFASLFKRRIEENQPTVIGKLSFSLGTNDPIMSMLLLLNHMDAEVIEQHHEDTDAAMSHWLYSYYHELLVKEGIAVDEEADCSVFDSQEWRNAILCNVSYQLYEKEEDGNANINFLAVLCDKLERRNRENATLRPNNHTILADAMITFKQNNDFSKLFEQFGTPLIKQAGTKDLQSSNVDVLMPKNEGVREIS